MQIKVSTCWFEYHHNHLEERRLKGAWIHSLTKCSGLSENYPFPFLVSISFQPNSNRFDEGSVRQFMKSNSLWCSPEACCWRDPWIKRENKQQFLSFLASKRLSLLYCIQERCVICRGYRKQFCYRNQYLFSQLTESPRCQEWESFWTATASLIVWRQLNNHRFP